MPTTKLQLQPQARWTFLRIELIPIYLKSTLLRKYSMILQLTLAHTTDRPTVSHVQVVYLRIHFHSTGVKDWILKREGRNIVLIGLQWQVASFTL